MGRRAPTTEPARSPAKLQSLSLGVQLRASSPKSWTEASGQRGPTISSFLIASRTARIRLHNGGSSGPLDRLHPVERFADLHERGSRRGKHWVAPNRPDRLVNPLRRRPHRLSRWPCPTGTKPTARETQPPNHSR